MQITEIHDFLKWYAKVKGRTRRLFPFIPTEQIEWRPMAGMFSFGDLIRHLACIERMMYAETVQGRPSRYQGCGTDLAEGYQASIDYYDRLNAESVAIFSQLTAADLVKKCQTPAGIEITTWKWLRAMAEHEIHHRGQMYTYLRMLGIDSPPIYGLTSEEVAARSQD